MMQEIELRPKKRRFRFWFAVIVLILFGTGLFIGSRAVILAQKILDHGSRPLSFGEFFIASDKKLIGEAEGEIRLLLLGIGGGDHPGATLTDTIILATIRPDQNNQGPAVSLVSIPRDLVVSLPGYEYRKINSAYAFGELKEEREGAKMAIEAVEKITGDKIPYYAVVDFEGFRKIIDDLGGVDIDIPVGFTDAYYPDKRSGYIPAITFEKGIEHMNGQRALQYVRSRHGNNNQGSDFARAKRQQQILRAVGEKIRDINLITNLGLVNRLLDDVADNFRTNLEIYELKRLYDLGKDLDTQKILTHTIDGQSGLVCDQIIEENGAYVLVPCKGLADYSAIRAFIANQFAVSVNLQESASIEIQNASGIELLSRRTASYLGNEQLDILSSNFRGETQFRESIIYDNTRGGKPNARQYLQEKLNLEVAESPFPFPTSTNNPDFVIVVTKDIESQLP